LHTAVGRGIVGAVGTSGETQVVRQTSPLPPSAPSRSQRQESDGTRAWFLDDGRQRDAIKLVSQETQTDPPVPTPAAAAAPAPSAAPPPSLRKESAARPVAAALTQTPSLLQSVVVVGVGGGTV